MPLSFFPTADAATRARLEADPVIALANSIDWAATELGPIANWPEALRSAARLVLTSAVPMALLIGSRGVMLYNGAYAPIAGKRHPSVMGQSVFDGWPEVAEFNADIIGRVAGQGESLSFDRTPFTFYRNDVAEMVYLNLDYTPVLDEGGRGVAVLALVHEVTEQLAHEAALAESELRFRTLADTMPQMVWSTLPDGFHDYYNARWYEFTGVPEGSTDGEGWNGMFHPEDQEHAWAVWRHSLATGEPYRIEYRLRHRSGEYRWVLGQALPIRDAAGRIVRWFGTCTDIHEARLAQEEREVIAQELSHRIKNIFAVIGGIVALAARTYPEASGLATELRARIISLGKAHDFVRPHSRASAPGNNPNSLRQLISELMSPYRLAGEDRITITGDDAAIDEAAATPLALIFHELATNAAKYGALSKPEGEVRIEIASNGESVRVTWREIGGSPGPLSDKQGFGSRLMSLSVEGQLKGTLTRRWEPDGLAAEVTMPLASLSRKATLQ